MNVVASKSFETQFGIAWNWEHDADFVELLDRACWERGVSCYRVGPHNLPETFSDVENGRRRFGWLLDRASDEDPRFLQLNQLLQLKGTRFLNSHHRYQWSIDKANIHGALQVRGLQLPVTVIVPAREHQPEFDARLIEPLLKPFVIKPSRGGGGRGVSLDARHAEQVMLTRASHHHQRLLLQQRIVPQTHNGRRAWFRVFYVCGQVIACWWDDVTHLYSMMMPRDREVVNHDELTRIVRIIAEVSQLDFFSAEIALDGDGRYVVIDYVNDPCDMRLQSKCFDGVPDTIVRQIVGSIVNQVKTQVAAPLLPPAAGDAALWP